MQTLLKATATALFLVSGAAVMANAQSVGPAAGGPGVSGPSVATLPAPADMGPRTSSHNFIPSPHSSVTPSQAYVGPAPGASDAKVAPHYEPPATYTTDPSMHPYTTGTVRPN
jgi:hypothetical protein